MTGVIEGHAGAGAKGKWDIATAPAAAATGAAPSSPCRSRASTQGGGRAGQVPDQREGPDRRVQGSTTCRPRRRRWPTRRSVDDQRLLQQRPGRQDLRRRRQAAEAGLHRPEEPGGPHRGGERPARRGAGQRAAGAWRGGQGRPAGRRSKDGPGRAGGASWPPPAHRPTRAATTDRRDAREHRCHDPAAGAPTVRPGPHRPLRRGVRARAAGRTRSSRRTSTSRRSSCSSASSGSTRWCTRSGSPCTTGTCSRRAPVSGLDNYVSCSPTRTSGTPWSTPPASSSSPPCRSCCWRCCWPTCSTGGCARAPSSGWR